MPITGSEHAKSYARLGVLRLGASRLDYYQPWVKVVINGVVRTGNVRISGATIQQTLDGTPDTATCRVEGFTPSEGQEVKIYLGDTDTAHLLFAGHILTVTTTYEDVPTNIVHDINCIDYTWRLNTRKIAKKYTSTAADAIIKNLISTYTTGITVRHVTSGLATLDEFTLTNEDLTDALDRIAARIGAYWFLDYGNDLWFFLESADKTTDVTDTMPGAGVTDVAKAVDLSQVRTRVWSRGGGSVATIAIPVGATTLPVEDGTWYSTSGGYVESGPQRITYTGKGTLDGQSTTLPPPPTTAPGAPAVAQANTGTANTFVSGNLAEGTFKYKVTFVTDSVEGSAGPAAKLTIVTVAAPDGTNLSLSSNTGGGMTDGAVYYYKTTFVTVDGETLGSTGGFDPYNDGNDGGSGTTLFGNAMSIAAIPKSPDARVTARRIYRRMGSGHGDTTYRLVTTINDNTTTTYKDTDSDATISVRPAIPNIAAVQTGKGNVTSIAVGPTGTTERKLYRTVKNGATFKLVTTIADNSTTTYLDNIADLSLGADLPTESIGASIGDTSLRVVDLAQVPSSGWLYVGENLVRYTGRSATSGSGTVTGIPASGFGAILVNIPAGEAVVVAPHLTGVAGILYAIAQGDEVNVLTMNEDTTAQSTFAGLIGSGDGIVEEFIQDGRLSLTEADARGAAKLAELKDPLTTVTLTTRDQTFRVGRSTTFTLTNPSVSGTYKVQRVTITDIAQGGAAILHFPVRRVEASSRRFSFEGLLRQIKAS